MHTLSVEEVSPPTVDSRRLHFLGQVRLVDGKDGRHIGLRSRHTYILVTIHRQASQVFSTEVDDDSLSSKRRNESVHK